MLLYIGLCCLSEGSYAVHHGMKHLTRPQTWTGPVALCMGVKLGLSHWGDDMRVVEKTA